MTMNVHLLTHLVNYTRAWGPVWVFSCFPFETMNHVLKQHFHGTREVAMQVSIKCCFSTSNNCMHIFQVDCQKLFISSNNTQVKIEI